MNTPARQFTEALGNIRDQYIEEAERYHRHPRRWLFPAAAALLAACIALAFFVVPGTSEPPPVYENALFSAQQIGDAIDQTADRYDPTNTYIKVYAPDIAGLYLTPVPTESEVTVYTYAPATVPTDRPEFEAFAEHVTNKLGAALGTGVPAFAIEENSDGDLHARFTGLSSGLTMSILQSAGSDRALSLSSVYLRTSGDSVLTLNGQNVAVDRRQSDGQLLQALEPVSRSLFELFRESFDSAKVTRNYNGYDSCSIDVTYCNADDTLGIGNAIRLTLSGDSDILNKVSIYYRHHRADIDQIYPPLAQCRMISLSEAEYMLHNGYVFGGHACPLCMAGQEKVSFQEYDAVGFEYLFGGNMVIPFYTFFKEIGTSDSGECIYAKTYVCAIELSGIEEYFEAQKEQHQ